MDVARVREEIEARRMGQLRGLKRCPAGQPATGRRGRAAFRKAAKRAAQAGVALGGFALIAAANGCAPMLASFVQPQAPGGEITNRTCPPQPEVLLFKREGVVAAVYVGRVESGRRTICFTFEVPRGRTVRLLGSSLDVSTPRGDRLRSQLTGVWRGSGNRSVPARPESLMIGRTERFSLGTRTGYGVTRHDFFDFSAEFATELGDNFTVILPKVVVNGFSWDLPPVRFTRVRRWLIMPFNC